MLCSKLGKKGEKKKRKKVGFKDYVPAWPPCATPHVGKWQECMCRIFKTIVIELIVNEIKHDKSENSSPWTGMTFPREHPGCRIKDNVPVEAAKEYEAWQGDWWSGEHTEEPVSSEEDVEDDIMNVFMRGPDDDRHLHLGDFVDEGWFMGPIACAFVHQTGWTTKLREFRQNSVAFVNTVTRLGAWYYDAKNVGELVEEWANDCGVDTSDEEFWRGFESTREQCGQQFFATLEQCTKKLCGHIMDLEECYDKKYPSSVEVVLKRRMWEVEAIDWIHTKEEEAYLFLYKTPGEYFYYIDYSRENPWGSD